MKIQYCSDLHLEFPENRRFIARNPIKPAAEILLLAGDIVTFSELEKASDFFNFVSDQFLKVYWVPGNHEHYGSDITNKPVPLYEDVRTNVHLVNNYTLHRHGYRFIFSTLWSKIDPLHAWDIERGIRDFSAIRFEGQKLTAHRFTQLHAASLLFVKAALQAEQKIPTIVVTHHVPTLLNYPTAYKNSPLNGAFATELFELIDDHGPEAWIYGHHHFNNPPFRIGRTNMLTNQLGYVHCHEHRSFQRDAMLSLPH